MITASKTTSADTTITLTTTVTTSFYSLAPTVREDHLRWSCPEQAILSGSAGMLIPVTSANPVGRRTAAATRLPWPQHDWCSVALPMHLVPGSLTILEGHPAAIAALRSRIARVNEKRAVLSPAPLV